MQFNSNNDAEVSEDTPVNEEDNEHVHFQDFQKPDFSTPISSATQPVILRNNQGVGEKIPLKETPVPQRKFSVRDRNLLRHPRRPLDESFQFSLRSTPIKDIAESSSDGTLFTTPKASLSFDTSGVSDCPSRNEELPTNSGQTCPNNMQSIGKRVILSKITKQQLLEMALNLSLTTDGLRDSLMKNIDHFYR